MAHSLTIGRQIELFGGGQTINNGPAQGAQVRLGSVGSSSFDLGAGEPQTTVITSLLLDGERPVGRRTGNAQVTLPVYVLGPGIRSLVAAREMILQIVDQETWELVLTLEGLPPTVFDCLRAKVTTPIVLREMNQDVLTFTVTAQRLPFGRSDDQQRFTIDAPPGTPGGGSVGLLPTMLISDFNSLASLQVTRGSTWLANTSIYKHPNASVETWASSEFLLSNLSNDLTGYKTVTYYVSLSGTAADRSFQMSFYDDQNKEWRLQERAPRLPGGDKWVKVTVSLTVAPPPAGFHVYAIRKLSFLTNGGIRLDYMTADAVSINVVGGARGGVYQLHDAQGSARAPLNLDIYRPSLAAMTSGLVHRPKTVPDNWTPLIELNPATPLDDRWLTLPIQPGQLATTDINDRWNGTYDIVLSIAVIVGAISDSRTTTLTIRQDGGGGIDLLKVARTYTPRDIGATAKYLFLGRATLPPRDLPRDAAGAHHGLSLLTTGVTGGLFDSFTDLMFIDTEGQTIVWQNTIAQSHVYIDEPDPVLVNHGAIFNGSAHATSVSISDKVTAMSGEPISLDPDENSLLVHCWDGAAKIDVIYTPRWRGLRTE